MLVLDANVVLAATCSRRGFAMFGREPLVAPALLWPEARSALHQSLWRGLISPELAQHSLRELDSGHVRQRSHPQQGHEAWRIADVMGWAKTYDAEYLALGALLRATLITLDRRMHAAAQRLGLAADVPGAL